MCERAAFSSPPHFNQILNDKMIKTETNISAVVNGKRKLVNMIQGEGGNNIVGDILDANAVDEKIDAAVSGDSQISQNYVAVNKQQSFTDTQKRTARENIGALSTDTFNPNDYYTKGTTDSLFVQSSTIRTIVTLTQAEFDALQNKDANTEYNIIES